MEGPARALANMNPLIAGANIGNGISTGNNIFGESMSGWDYAGCALSVLTLGESSWISGMKIPVYRAYGGETLRLGNYYSFINPKYVPFYSKFAGLPAGNTQAFLLYGKVTLGNIYNYGKIGLASRIGKNFGGMLELNINYKYISPTKIRGLYNYDFH